MKECKRCGEIKEDQEFHKDKKNKDGLKNICKKCRNKKQENKINKRINYLINKSMKESIKKNKNGYIWETIVGYNLLDLKLKLEHNFNEDMNWDNYGTYWIIDKIISPSHYKQIELRKPWSLKNIRPLSIKEHKRKKKKIDYNLVKEYSLYDILPIGKMGDIL